MGEAFTAAQAIEHGATYRQLSRAVSKRVYERPWRGIYVHPNASYKEMLVALGLGAGPYAVISGRAAAYLWGIWAQETQVYEVTVPPKHRFKRKGVIVHQSPVDDADITTVDGISGVTTLARTIIDLAGEAYGLEFDQAFYSAWLKSPTLLDDLEARLEELGPGRHGIKKLRRLIAEARWMERPMESPLEVEFWKFRRGTKLPRPRPGVEFDDGSPKKFRADFVWLKEKLIVEIDSFKWHLSRDSWANDCQKQTRAAALGYRVMRITKEDFADPKLLEERISGALGLQSLTPKLRWGRRLRWPQDSLMRSA